MEKFMSMRQKWPFRAPTYAPRTAKFNLNIEGIAVNKNQITINTFNLKSSEHWLKTQTLEAPVLHADMFNTKITGYNLDSLLLAGKFHNADVTVGSFYVHANEIRLCPMHRLKKSHFRCRQCLS